MFPTPATTAVAVQLNRTLPGNEAAGGGGEVNTLNLVFIVAFALIISVLAQYLARRGGRGGKK